VEAVINALGGTPDPLIDAIKAGKIRGAVGVAGFHAMGPAPHPRPAELALNRDYDP